MVESNGWLKELLTDHSNRLARIEEKVNNLTGKVYANAALISIGVAVATAFIVQMLMQR